MKKIKTLFGLTLFTLVLSSCGGSNNPSDPAHTHQWGLPSYTWADDNSKCTAKKVCELNTAHVESETVNSSYEVVTPATETEDGLGRYTATFTKEGFSTQTKEVPIFPEGHVHTFAEGWTYDETYHWHASTCNHPVKSGEAKHTFNKVKDGDITTYTCTVCGYSYSKGTRKLVEYKDNAGIPEDLNKGFKELFANHNFTASYEKQFDNVEAPIVAPNIPDGFPTRDQYIAQLDAALTAGDITQQEYNEYLAQYDAYAASFSSGAKLYVNGQLNSVVKFDKFEFEQTVSFTGKVYLKLNEVLSAYSVASWDALKADEIKMNKFRNDINTAISSNASIKMLSDCVSGYTADYVTPVGNEIILTENVSMYMYEFYDEELEQFYLKSNSPMIVSELGSVDGYAYLNSANLYYESAIYSMLELFILSASYLDPNSPSPLMYNAETHTYNREYWGSGGGSLFYTGSVFPIEMNGDHIVKIANKTVKDNGTTKITADRTVSSCAHEHGTICGWHNKTMHAEYCVDCGRAVSKESHEIHNDLEYCRKCNAVVNYPYLEKTYPEYVGKNPSADRVVYVDEENHIKYCFGNPVPAGADVAGIAGKDGRYYKHYDVAPTNGVEYSYGTVSESIEVEKNSCVFSVKYKIFKYVYNVTYIQMTEETRPDEVYMDEVSTYWSRVPQKTDDILIDTVYEFPSVRHTGLSFENMKFLSFEEAAVKNPRVARDYKYIKEQTKFDTKDFLYIEANCQHCGESMIGCVLGPNDCYYIDYFRFMDKKGKSFYQYLFTKYLWEEDYSKCTAVLYYESREEGTVDILTETVNSVYVEEEGVYVAEFSSPIFDKQVEGMSYDPAYK